MPALPFSPVKFSALIERVCAFDSSERLPKLMLRPLNVAIICPLDHFKISRFRERWKRSMWLRLIPEGSRGDVVLQRQIAPFLERSVMDGRRAPAQRLNRHAQIFFEANRIHHVPAIQP